MKPDPKAPIEITCTLNGSRRAIEPGTTIAGLLAQLGLSPPQVVVEYNGEPLERERYALELHGGDRLEIAQMVGGG